MQSDPQTSPPGAQEEPSRLANMPAPEQSQSRALTEVEEVLLSLQAIGWLVDPDALAGHQREVSALAQTLADKLELAYTRLLYQEQACTCGGLRTDTGDVG